MSSIVKKSVLAGALCFYTLMAGASLNDDMNKFFGKLGYEQNTTTPKVWQGQAAGYATGGALYARTSAKDVQLVSLQLPSLNAGCGGIDMFLGSFSFISKDEFIQFAKSILSNAPGLFFDLALKTVTPQLASAKDFLQKLASDVNSSNMSSCQAARGIVGGLWPETQENASAVCQTIGSDSNFFSDWAAARQGCGTGGQYKNMSNKAGADMKDQVLRNKNLIWESLEKNQVFSGNKELKEFAMSLTGTLIFDDDGKPTWLEPQTTKEDIIHALLNGGTAQIYTCNDSECLKTAVGQVTISADSSLSGQVNKMLQSISSKAYADEALTDKERGFISSTSVPVLRYLVDPLSLGISDSVIYQLSDYISFDILIQYMQEIIQQSQMMLASKSYPEGAMKSLKEGLGKANQLMAIMQSRVQVQQSALMVVERQMSYMRQQLSGRLLDRYQNNYRFSGGQ
ncbi:conjugal transfer pilus assembly protein TraH [Yokenella regensburgei]|uniref:conjugal transfer pilus assembly protein TraH n=1 Tax=Yokenella regensburgei TaxID=158877 RepID=UPI003ED9B948